MGGPADTARPQAHLFCPQALRNTKIDRGAGITRFRLNGRKTIDGLQHVGTPLGVVEHAAITSETGGYPATCLVHWARSRVSAWPWLYSSQPPSVVTTTLTTT